MEKSAILFIALFGLACSGSLVNSEIEKDPETQKFTYSFNDSPSKLSSKISGFYSLAGYQSVNTDQSIHLYKNYSKIVFAVDKNENPLFVSTPRDGQIIFNTTETAITLISLFASDFVPDSYDNFENRITNHAKFDLLLKKLEESLSKTGTFADDKKVFDTIDEIHTDLCQYYYHLKPSSKPVELVAQSSDKIVIKNQSKLPFTISGRHFASDESLIYSILNGKKLGSESSKKSNNSNTNVQLSEGANIISVYNNLQSEKARFRKTAKDLILKFQSVLRIENYSENALTTLTNSLFKHNEDNETLNSSRHKEVVLSELKANSQTIKNYLVSQLNGIASSRESLKFLDLMNLILEAQGESAIIFSDDSYYQDLDYNSGFNDEQQICIQNSEPVACEIASEKITYSIGTAGCKEHEFEIKFGSRFYAPFGLNSGSKLKIEWEYENGKSGFWLISYSDSKEKISGLNSTVGCFNFGDKSKLTLREQIVDHLGNRGNVSTVEIEKPKLKTGSSRNNSEAAVLVQN